MRHGLHLQANGSPRSSALGAAGAPNCGPTNPWRPITKNSMSSWSEATSGVRCRTIGRYRCRLRGSRYSGLRQRFRQPPGRLLEGIWIRQQFRRPRLGARLLQTVESFLVSRGFATPLSTIATPTRHMRAGASRKRHASSFFVRTSIRLIAHDIAGATPHPSCSSEYGIRS
jgi:hypothetical protein